MYIIMKFLCLLNLMIIMLEIHNPPIVVSIHRGILALLNFRYGNGSDYQRDPVHTRVVSFIDQMPLKLPKPNLLQQLGVEAVRLREWWSDEGVS